MASRPSRPDPLPDPGALARPALFTADELAAFKARVAPLVGFDIEAYKPRQMERRITALLVRAGLKSLAAYAEMLEGEPHRLAEFVDGLTINVSEFFRNPEKWVELAEDILPELLARHGHLHIWSAGCSMGAELYSTAIVLDELGALERATFVGTDLDRPSLAQAEAGLYGAHELKGVSPERLARYFEPAEGRYRLASEAIRARTRFKRANLLEDPPEVGCHLILCRNVVIYLNESGKLGLYRDFERALVPGGVLFVGSTERIFTCRELGLEPHGAFFYQKPPVDDREAR